MQGFVKAYSRIAAKLSLVALLAAGTGLVTMTLIVASIVFGRYVLNDTPTWGEPASLLLMLWFILLGAAVGVREMDHMGFDITLHYLQGRAKTLLIVANDALVAAFGVAMSWYGTLLASKVWSDTIPMIGVSKGWDYVPMICGGALIAFFSIEKLLLLAVGARQEPMLLAAGGHRSME